MRYKIGDSSGITTVISQRGNTGNVTYPMAPPDVVPVLVALLLLKEMGPDASAQGGKSLIFY